MKRRDFLVEIGTEELPPRALKALMNAFAATMIQAIDSAGLKHGRTQPYATPRRLALLVKGLAESQPEQEVKRRGPPVSAAFDTAGEPTRAGLAFARSCGVEIETLQRISEPKGEFLFFSGRHPGQDARDLLPGMVQAALDALPIPKRMRWGSGEVQFIRPVHWMVMLFGAEVLPATVLGIESGQFTRGHRFHAPKALRIASPGAYATALRKRGFVLADFAERQAKVRSDVAALARSLGGEPVGEEALYEEVAALVEWPVALAGRFDERFLSLPREVLITTLQSHQRYFPVAAGGRLLPHFVAVANLESRDPSQVRAGNERVVLPRLSDAEFFYTTDRKQTLLSRAPALDTMAFQARLGSLGDRTRRVTALARHVAAEIDAPVDQTERAAQLAKCDLVTGMVGEFPELQGTMGRYYAIHDGEPEQIAQAIEEHYLPRFAGDRLPASRTGMALAVADKLDTVAGIFAIGQKPTGARDPFGVRRAALGLLRILIEKRLAVDLNAAIQLAVSNACADIARSAGGPETDHRSVISPPAHDLAQEVYLYLMERLRAYYLESDGAITVEMFDAVLATQPAEPLDFDIRLRALEQFLKFPEAASLTSGNKRIANILRQAGEQVPQGAPEEVWLRHAAEQQLFADLNRLAAEVPELFAARRYEAGLARLAALHAPIDAFFDSVMVMDEDTAVRGNRLKLLRALRELFLKAADLSRLPG